MTKAPKSTDKLKKLKATSVLIALFGIVSIIFGMLLHFLSSSAQNLYFMGFADALILLGFALTVACIAYYKGLITAQHILEHE